MNIFTTFCATSLIWAMAVLGFLATGHMAWTVPTPTASEVADQLTHDAERAHPVILSRR